MLLLFASIAAAHAESLEPVSDNLASEQLFSGKYNKEKGVTITISIRDGKYNRTMTVTKNPALAKIMTDAFNADRKRASAFNQYISGNDEWTNIEITRNGEIIRIGLTENKGKEEVMLFINGSEKAFK